MVSFAIINLVKPLHTTINLSHNATKILNTTLEFKKNSIVDPNQMILVKKTVFI